MAELLKCKYCEQSVAFQKCIQHLKQCHGLYSTNPFSFYERIVTDTLVKTKTKQKKQSKPKTNKGRKRCYFCGIVFESKEHKDYHLWKVHGKTKNKSISQKSEIYQPPKPDNKSFHCGEFLGLRTQYVKIYYSALETNRRKH